MSAAKKVAARPKADSGVHAVALENPKLRNVAAERAALSPRDNIFHGAEIEVPLANLIVDALTGNVSEYHSPALNLLVSIADDLLILESEVRQNSDVPIRPDILGNIICRIEHRARSGAELCDRLADAARPLSQGGAR